jgi:signal recognition particle receptor subunit beta
MAFVNYLINSVAVKIVYFGPGLSGKTTNVRYIAQKLDSSSRGELICLESDTSRTYFFDLLFVNAGLIGDFKVHFHLMTCPGQIFYEASRRSVLSGADGVVFVADSQVPLLDANLESFESLRRNLEELHLDINTLPLVFQYNKRDLEDLTSLDTFNNLLNPYLRPYFEAEAINGRGVFETFRGIAGLVLPVVRQHILSEQPEEVEVPETETETEKKVEEALAKAGVDTPEAEPRIQRQISQDIRKIKLKSERDIEKELEKLSCEFSKKG